MRTALSKVGELNLHRVLDGDAQELERIVSSLNSGVQGFPGPNPVSIDRTHFQKLGDAPYSIAEKTDGTRFALLCANYAGKHVCAIFDRTMTPYLVGIKKVPRAMFEGGTIFDGELTWDSTARRWAYLIFDAVVVCGVTVATLPFAERLAAASTALEFYAPDFHDDAVLRVKKFLRFSATCGAQYAQHVEEMRTRHAIDGTVFMPELDPIVYGQHDGLFKLKSTHSVDFLVKNGKLCVYDAAAKRNKVVGAAVGPRADLALEGYIVECVLDPTSTKHEKWNVLTLRTDKKKSNSKFTFDKTMLNVRENLKLQDVIQGAFPKSTSSVSTRWGDMA
jgi:hypothetical protein